MVIIEDVAQKRREEKNLSTIPYRKQRDGRFKSQADLGAIGNQQTIAQIASGYDVN